MEEFQKKIIEIYNNSANYDAENTLIKKEINDLNEKLKVVKNKELELKNIINLKNKISFIYNDIPLSVRETENSYFLSNLAKIYQAEFDRKLSNKFCRSAEAYINANDKTKWCIKICFETDRFPYGDYKCIGTNYSSKEECKEIILNYVLTGEYKK